MITVDEALQILQKNLPQPGRENVSLYDAYCHYLADDILAPEPSPRYTNSAMDGFALRWQDVMNTSQDAPVRLTISGESQAGLPYGKRVQAGEAVRISTGAVLPEGADTVVRVEDTKESNNSVSILDVRGQGQDVRHAGEEFQAGERLLYKGEQLKTRQQAMLASVGIHEVSVFSIPRASLLITGTELVTSDDVHIKPFQIRDSNKVMLQSAVREAGGEVISCLHVADDLESTVQTLEQSASENPDLILCSGGVSVGRHDHVKKAAVQAGFSELFWRIRQKPGKPLFAARKDNILLFGLPGNPVSAFMCFQHYVRPIISFLQGQEAHNKSITAQAQSSIENKGDRTNFHRVKVDFVAGQVPLISGIGLQGSHMLSSITHADGYIILEPGERVKTGSLKEVFLF